MSGQSQNSNGSVAVRLILSGALFLGALLIFVYRQPLIDTVIVWQFQPTASVASIAKSSFLSDRGHFLFYASQPELLTRDPFNESCRTAATEQSAVLGCYTMNRIYLFDVENEQLAGIKQVTSAHEMLHAAYQRLSGPERSRIDALLEKQSFGAEESRLTALMAEYEKSEPGERSNELHSILGTELRALSPELETYYAQYFSDRSGIVALSEQYQRVFDDLKARQESLATDINNLADAVERSSVAYKRNLQVLSSDVDSFNTAARSGTMSRGEYNSRRADLEGRQMSLKREYDAIQAMIADYERKRTELASINTEANALNRSINSSLTPVPDGIDG